MKYRQIAFLVCLGLGGALSAHAAPLSFTFMLCELSSEKIDDEVASLLGELARVRAVNTRSSQYRKHVEWHARDTSRRLLSAIDDKQCSQERTDELTRAWEKLEKAL